MIEVILLPYMAISLLIGWAVYSPFSSLDDYDSISFSKFRLIDLLSCFIPISFLLALALNLLVEDSRTPLVLVLVTSAILAFSAFTLGVALFLLDRIPRATPLKRMVLNGIIVPAGTLLTIAWVAIPISASSYSIFYAIPAVLVVVGLTLALRSLSNWMCDKPLWLG